MGPGTSGGVGVGGTQGSQPMTTSTLTSAWTSLVFASSASWYCMSQDSPLHCHGICYAPNWTYSVALAYRSIRERIGFYAGDFDYFWDSVETHLVLGSTLLGSNPRTLVCSCIQHKIGIHTATCHQNLLDRADILRLFKNLKFRQNLRPVQNFLVQP